MPTPAASAPVTTSLLLPGDLAMDPLPFTLSEAGVGSDGRTTYVAKASQGAGAFACPAECRPEPDHVTAAQSRTPLGRAA
jgi:hypothetical protein